MSVDVVEEKSKMRIPKSTGTFIRGIISIAVFVLGIITCTTIIEILITESNHPLDVLGYLLLFGIAALAFSLPGYFLGKSASRKASVIIKLYVYNPKAYLDSSRKIVKAAKILGIIGRYLNFLLIPFLIWYFVHAMKNSPSYFGFL